jgi:SAM-dependent methyltransferase
VSSTDEQARIERAYRRFETEPRQRRLRDSSNQGTMRLMREWHDALIAGARERGVLGSGARVLDIGCGDGWLLERLAGEVGPGGCAGIDPMPTRISAAAERAPGADLRRGGGEDLPFADDSFDLVCLGMVLSSILDPSLRRRVAREARRVVRPGGLIACYELQYASPGNPDVEAVSPTEVRELFGPADVQTRSISLLPPIARRLGPLTGLLYPLLSALPPLRGRHLSFLTPRP